MEWGGVLLYSNVVVMNYLEAETPPDVGGYNGLEILRVSSGTTTSCEEGSHIQIGKT